MKDNFSSVATGYQLYRPGYPDELISFIHSLIPNPQIVWDCATGSGQLAQKLAAIYPDVYATDISESQLDKAVKLPNIHYSCQPAEKTSFSNDFFDLITVGQAVHWFNFDQFYSEVGRVARPNAILLLVGYSNPVIEAAVDAIVDRLYTGIVGRYWDTERHYIDEMYQTLPFPFDEIIAHGIDNTYQWSLEHFVGYLNTWSAVAHYIRDNQSNPVDIILPELRRAWGSKQVRTVSFPLLLKIGRIKKD